ncbi:prephenate dehydrogenase/arogenate dehydrogenase family protein [Halobacterium zhouii]|uniref:prephenate dehydrogenase/arogenate dehydrogenase family protein n=1 Tax=Halobacterium zhouii TaxID=2902624 RepID=UPI001E44E6A4|nr:prephenate dehydrogenase/arogenate dehydrogenase family protein [Halobacterium zhouii]
MDVLVVGAGAVGRWFGGLADAPVAFADADPERAEAAADVLDSRSRAVALDTDDSFGLVAVTVPMDAAADAVQRHAPKAQQAVVDFTGTMERPLRAMAEAAPARERVSFHPLFAPENAPGRIAVAESAPGPATDRVREWLEAAGNDLVDVDAAEHDDAMATVQGRAHAAVLSFALAADDVPEELGTPVYDALSELAERVTGGNARVYGDIQREYGGADEIAAAAQRLADAAAAEESSDAATTEESSDAATTEEPAEGESSGERSRETFAEVYDDAC